MSMSTKAIIKVDFKNIDRVSWSKFSPAILVFNKTIFRISSWKALLKIFYYLCYKADSKNAEYFDSLKDRFISVINGRFARTDRNIAHTIYQIKQKYIFSSTQFSAYDGVKFSKTCYVSCYETSTPNRFTGLEYSVIDNLTVINQVANDLKLKRPTIYLSNPEADAKTIESQTNQIIKKLTDKDCKDRKKEKSARYFIAHINGEVLSPEEKFYKRINVEFDKKVLLGDIAISEVEEKYLHDYMSNFLSILVKNTSSANMPFYPKVFAFGLVRYAMKYYGRGTFFPYFKHEYGIELNAANQGQLHDIFQCIMVEYDKLYDEKAATRIDNINMHCFVTDKCAPQFFDYIFDYWRLDLNRNIENIYGEGGPALFNRLINEIKANNVTAVNNIMKHTSMALVMNEKSGRMRIKRFLQLIDKCFWDHIEVPQTGNRFNRLLKDWMDNPKGKFQAEYQKAKRQTYQKGEKLLSHPILAVRVKDGSFSIKLPRQILPHCEQDEYPVWTIVGDNGRVSEEAKLMEGRIGLYTEECEISLPVSNLFDNIRMTLSSEKRRYASFNFKKSDIRFFNDKGVCVDHSKGFLPEGMLLAYSNSPDIPQIIYQPPVPQDYSDGIYRCLYNVKRGDILKFNDGHAIPVGNDISEGLTENALDGAKMEHNGDMLSIYPVLPKIIFKTTRDRLTGTALTVTRANGNEQFVKVSEQHYFELKLDSSLDDSYAYIIDLSEFIGKDGIYKVLLNIPGTKTIKIYEFAYLKDFKYKFINAPYIFKDSGEILFPDYIPLNIDDDWTITTTGKSLTFSFNEQTEYGKSVKDCKIDVEYNLYGNSVVISIDVPALFWKYSKEDDWNYRCPADVPLKKLPRTLYVRGPFDFRNKSSKLYVDNSENFDETDVYASHQNGTDYYGFNLSNVKSWIDYSKACRTINIVLDGVSYQFLKVICHSIITSGSIYYDYETQELRGKFSIISNSDFTVKVEHDGQIIGQDIPLENGQFLLETDSPGGDYLVTVYEIIDSDDGFDADTVKIGEYTLSLFDISKLAGNIIAIKSIQDTKGKWSPLKLDLKYFIAVEELLENPDTSLIIGIWKANLYDEAQLKKCSFYRGTLGHYDGATTVKDFSVLVVFFSKADTTQLSILREYDGEYVELLYDYKTHSLVQSDEGLTRLQKLERIELLSDDKYECEAEILKSTINNEGK